MHNNLPDETSLANGQKFELLSLALLGVPSMAEQFLEVSHTMSRLKFDAADYVCLKFILLLNSGVSKTQNFKTNFDLICIFFAAEVRNLTNVKHVQDSSEQVHSILMEYCHNCYPNVPVSHHPTTTSDTYLLWQTIKLNAVHLLKLALAIGCDFNTWTLFRFWDKWKGISFNIVLN